MRSIGYLIQLFPEKTGKEILEIQAQDKLEDEKEYQKENESKLKWIEDINTNGGFFKGRFGIDQRFFYKVSNCLLETSGEIRCDVEKIVVFLGSERDVVKNGNIHIEKKSSEYADADKYGFNIYDRVTEKEWNEVNSYLEGIEKFWNDIKEVE